MHRGRRLAIGLALAAGFAAAGVAPMLASARPAPAAGPEAGTAIPLRALAWRLGVLAVPLAAPAPVPDGEEPAPAPASEPREPAFLTARVRAGAAVELRAAPGGRTLARVGATTEFGSPETLSVVERRGEWLAVVSPELPNGRVGWVKADRRSLRVGRTRTSIRIDLSRRLLVLRRGDDVLLRTRVGIGRPGSPTPTGRFSVTDKLSGAPYGTVYGCCVLALSAHQTRLPAGWKGGDRMAIHGTDDPSSVGLASSAGCLRASDADLRTLMRRVPLGTPVFVHP